jgi:hypothetical protein
MATFTFFKNEEMDVAVGSSARKMRLAAARAIPPIRTDIIKMILNVTISWFYLIGNRPSLGA